MALQLVYAGFTSRIIQPAGFGTFAVALAVTSLGGMLANSGLASAAARRPSEDLHGDRAIASASTGVGLIVAGVFAATAPLWARLWANPDATALIRVLCIGLVASSYGNSLAGVARRQGRIGAWTSATLSAAVIAMLLGGWATYTTRAAWSLTVMPVASAVLLGLFLLAALGRRGVPTRQIGQVGQDLIYGAKSLGSSLLTYTAYALPTWSMSRFLGPGVFGSWNRATVVGQVPLESAANAVTTVIFPRFRRDGAGDADVQDRWTNLMASAALVVLPLVALIVPTVPTLTRILLGPQWGESGIMAQFILIATGFGVLNTLLGTALQASSNFRGVWYSQAAVILILSLSSLALYATGAWHTIAIGYSLAAATSHAIQVGWASRHGFLWTRIVLMWYASAGMLCLLTWLAGSAIATATRSALGTLSVLILTATLCLGALFAARKHIGPLRWLMGEQSGSTS